MKIVNCIFCDDIRQEADGKQSLMGIFGGHTIHLLTHPIEKGKEKTRALRIGVYITIDFDDNDRNKELRHLEFRLENGETKMNLGKGRLNFPEKDPENQINLSAVISRFPVDIEKELKVTVIFFTENGDLIESVSPGLPMKFEETVVAPIKSK